MMISPFPHPQLPPGLYFKGISMDLMKRLLNAIVFVSTYKAVSTG
jgi:hypothetical protein